jgi:hypothetical protein
MEFAVRVSLGIACLMLAVRLVSYAMAPEFLKDSYTLFNEEYEHLSPIHGALIWEGDIARRYYNAALYAPRSHERWLACADGPSRLAQALFVETAGNFDISSHPNYPTKHMAISTIAHLIAVLEQAHGALDPLQLEDFILRDTAFQDSVSSTDRARQELKQHYDTLIKQARKQQQVDVVVLLQDSKISALNKLSTHRLSHDWQRRQSITQLKQRIAMIGQLKGPEKARAQKEQSKIERSLASLESAQSSGDYNRVRELAYALVDSYTTSSCHPPYIAQWLLLACLYRKAHTKSDWIQYMTILSEKIPAALRGKPDEVIAQSNFSHDETQYLKGINDFLARSYLSALDPELYEKLVYAQIIKRFYKGFLPKMAEYTSIKYQGVVFPDCVETTLLNICNMILYDRISGTCNIEKIPVERRSQILHGFYANPINRQISNNCMAEIHEAWGTSIQNLPYITYRQLIHVAEDGSRLALTAPKDTNGFIRGIPETTMCTLEHNGERVKIAGRWYIHVNNPRDLVCEMHPTLRNIVIVLDMLFKLNLFDVYPLEQSFLTTDFNARYMPLLCGNFALLNKRFTPEELASMDRDEYTTKGIRLEFNAFDLMLTDEHAEITMHIQRNSIVDLGPAIVATLVQDPYNRTSGKLAQLLSIFPIEQDSIPEGYPLTHILYLPLDHPRMLVRAALFCLHKSVEGALPMRLRDYLIGQAVYCLRQLPESLDWRYHEEFLRMVDARLLQHDLIQNELARIKSIALRRLSRSSAECEYVPALYTALTCKQGVDDSVMVVLDNLIARTESFDRSPLLRLLIELVKRGKAFKQAQQGVGICENSPMESERILAGQLSALLGNAGIS